MKVSPALIKKAHLRPLEDIGPVRAWEVDGPFIRENIDIEFTNFGIAPDFPWIPENELWLDLETHPDERRFFIDHMLTQWRYLHKGYSNAYALNKAYAVERSERLKSGDRSKIFFEHKAHPENTHVRLIGKTDDGFEVWLVIGRLVRSSYFIDFVDGGHHLVYPWVPENEVWIDDDVQPKEWPYIILHELHERRLMALGWGYPRAHSSASRHEWIYHQHPMDLPLALSNLGWHQ